MIYPNPIIPGFYPDPSVCRVGEDYYLVTSSFEYFPGVPIFHSRDLYNWRQIGYVLNRPEQLPLDKSPISCGIFAPTLRHHAGRFYMITTNVSFGGNFLVTASDPAGPWSAPVAVDSPGIDPSLAFDDDGACYITGNWCDDGRGGKGIGVARIDAASGKLLEPMRFIWSGTGGQHAEGPHLYHIGRWWYLLIAEGGTELCHMITIARSVSPYGPFESCPHNPILTHRSLPSRIHSIGHGDLVQDHRGNWWMVFLGTRHSLFMYPTRHHLGRETFLAPVTWTGDSGVTEVTRPMDLGWPVINFGRPIELQMDVPTALSPHPVPPAPTRDDFDSPDFAMSWNWLRNPAMENYSLTQRPGWLTLKGSAVTPDAEDSPTLICRRQQHFNCRAAALLDFAPAAENEEAGISVRMNDRHHYDLAVTVRNGKRCAIVRQRIGDIAQETACHPLPDEKGCHAQPRCACPRVELSIEATRDEYAFFATVGQDKIPLGKASAAYLTSEAAGGFTGVMIALYATGWGKPCTAAAAFDWFDYIPLPDDER
ncbi:MAG: glycoside hydrolase family 43 protein [Planctomycetaceae bacterium]|nr:glycoside hydrolase family 43 protein [Planctomycetaceae bacterium]